MILYVRVIEYTNVGSLISEYHENLKSVFPYCDRIANVNL
jgi:hypothetical protein